MDMSKALPLEKMEVNQPQTHEVGLNVFKALHPSVKHLQFKEVGIGLKGVSFAMATRRFPDLKRVDFYKIFVAPSVWSRLLSTLSSVIDISFRECSLGENEAKGIAGGIVYLTMVTKVTFRHNKRGPKRTLHDFQPGNPNGITGVVQRK